MFPLLGREYDWCHPVPPFYPLCSCRRSSPYCYCCCCRRCVGATSFHLYLLPCLILAAGVLLVCYVVSSEVLLFFKSFLPLESPPPILPGSRIFPLRSAKLQTLPKFLHCPPRRRKTKKNRLRRSFSNAQKRRLKNVSKTKKFQFTKKFPLSSNFFFAALSNFLSRETSPIDSPWSN